jgi:hypothetical protein
MTCRPSATLAEEACARQIISMLARRAYRRPTSAEDLETLMSFYQEGRKAGEFEDGIEFALRRLLASPQFLVRLERDPDNLAPDRHIASAIWNWRRGSRSFFGAVFRTTSCSILPARTNSTTRVLERQVRRMLADRRSDGMVKNFAAQWLYLRNLKSKAPMQTKFRIGMIRCARICAVKPKCCSKA